MLAMWTSRELTPKLKPLALWPKAANLGFIFFNAEPASDIAPDR
jgi:hypothetical protein